jgi:hypothetical protein
MKIRLVRGSLTESMATAVEIEPTLEAVATYLKAQYGFGDIAKDTIKVTAYAFDKRNDWGNTYIVYGSNGAALAFTNGPVKG